ncbi:MAG: FkbM family methyltransferase [Caldilineaceae bacterium]|nr:FkbM family methyltransferase [Caldilineaceae bacterium]
MRLNLFQHKGYWFHGKRREHKEMMALERIVNSDEIVAEVGGHIGYLSLWFAKLTREKGHVFVFEPGDNNLPYLKENVALKANVEVIECGCGEYPGIQEFYQDDLTGQNNSFVANFDGLRANIALAPGVKVQVKSRMVSVVRLDGYFKARDLQPGFVKIDTEGFEMAVLRGCQNLFDTESRPPKFMIEVQADNELIFTFFSAKGYEIFRPSGESVTTVAQMRGNLFVLHPEYHAAEIRRWLNGST